MNGRQGLIILAVILGLLLVGAGIWGWQQNRAKQTLTEENATLTEELEGLNELKEGLAREVDSLQQTYNVLAEENEILQGSLTEVQSQLAQKDAALRTAKRQSSAEVNNLRAEIQDLLAAKADLEASIFSLQAENDSLRTVTGILEADLSSARAENAALSSLNQTIQEEVKRLTLANFKATAFQVELEKKSSRATAKSSRARRIKVTFDLTDVPGEYQGTRPLYLVITDEKGTPVPASNAVEAAVVVNGQRMDLVAQQAREVNVTASQRLSFTHDLEDRLARGFYRVSVYTDIGLLGASSFRLQ